MSRSKEPPAVELARDLEDYQEHLGKVDLAHRAHVAQDLRALLRADRRNNQRAEDILMNSASNSARRPEDDVEDNRVLIDSPVEHHHHYPPALPQPSQASHILPWVLVAAMAAGAGGYGVSLLVNRDTPSPSTPPVAQPTAKNTSSGFLIELVPPELGKP